LKAQIAVVGGGISAATGAWLLAEQDHQVTLFEQAPKCGPVGAGIMLQPSGQRLLDRSGLLNEVLANSARIDALHAQHRMGRELVHLDYGKLNGELFGLGVLRGSLFTLLFNRCVKSGVEIQAGCMGSGSIQTSAAVSLIQPSGKVAGQFNIVVVADGSRSQLRRVSGLTRRVTEYKEAALWLTGPCHSEANRLLQMVDTTGRLVEILPVGNNRSSFFWGLTPEGKQRVWNNGMDAWKQQVMAFHWASEEILSDIHSFDDITFATYRNVRMKSVVDRRVVFVGDAAHATSPHLGQGANLALADAVCLADQLAKHNDYAAAFVSYRDTRRATTRYYSQLTGILAPVFQTQSRVQQFGRNLALPIMPKLPFVGKQMALTMAGLKSGWFRFCDDQDRADEKALVASVALEKVE